MTLAATCIVGGSTMMRLAKTLSLYATPGARDTTSPKLRLSAARHSNARQLEEAQASMDGEPNSWMGSWAPAPAPGTSTADGNPLERLFGWFRDLTPGAVQGGEAEAPSSSNPQSFDVRNLTRERRASKTSNATSASATFGGSFRQMTRDKRRDSVSEVDPRRDSKTRVSFGSPGSPKVAKV